MPDRPTHCNRPEGGCQMPPRVRLTCRTAPVVGRHRAPGLEFVEAFCSRDADAYADRVRKEGGEIVGRELLPAPEPIITPAPVGLDAVDPTPAPKPKRRRGTAKRGAS